MLDNIPSSYFPDFLKVSEEAPEKNQVYQFEKETRYIEKQNFHLQSNIFFHHIHGKDIFFHLEI